MLGACTPSAVPHYYSGDESGAEINGRSFDPVPYTEGVTDMDERARVNKAKDKKKRTEHPSSPVRKLPKFEEPPKDPDGGAVGA